MSSSSEVRTFDANPRAASVPAGCLPCKVDGGLRIFWVVFLTILTAIVAPSTLHGQSYVYATGSPTFSTAEPVELGFINVANGNLHIEIPIAAIPQRGTVPYVAKFVYDSRIWQNFGTGSWVNTNVPNSPSGWRFVTSADKGSVNDNFDQEECGSLGHTAMYYGPFVWTEASGSKHTFQIYTESVPLDCGNIHVFTGDAFADDSTGYHMYVTGQNTATIFAKDGTKVYSAIYEKEDTNGNYFTGTDGSVVDTLGRSPVTITTNGNTTTYAVLNSQGATSNYVVSTSTVNYKTAFGQPNVGEATGSFSAVTSITLPDQTQYLFSYDSGTTSGNYGLIKQVTLPTGGTVNYTFTTFADFYGNRNRWVATRTPSPGGQWTYTPSITTGCSGGVGCQQVVVVKPSTDKAVYTFTLNNGAWKSRADYYTGSTSLQMSLITDFDFSNACPTPPNGCTGSRYITVMRQTTQTPSVGGATLSKKAEYTYDNPTYANISQISEWQWTTGSFGSTPDRKTVITYLTSETSKDILDRPTDVKVTTGAGSWVSETATQYDQGTPTSITGVINHDDSGFGTSNTTRGNPTAIQRLLVSGATCPSTNCLQISLTYDTTGQVRSVTDPNGNATSISYTDAYFADNGANPPQSYTPTQATNAYPTQVTFPLVGAASFGYYFNSGKRASATDQNAATSYQHYLDSLDRMTHAYGPTVNSARAWRMMSYTGATQEDIYTGVNDTSASTGCTSCRHDNMVFDGMGRLTTSTIVNDPDGATLVDTTYDTSGRVSSVTNPRRTGSNGSDTVVLDGINRPLSVTHADSNIRSTYYGSTVSTNGGVAIQNCAVATYGTGFPSLAIDESARKRQVWTDGFGRIIETDEPDPVTGNLSSSSPSTCHKYDLLNNLTQLIQGSQTRTYAYDALSRLTSATTPEASGTATTYSYLTTSGSLCSGDVSNVCYQQDARGTTSKIVYAYDALNRLTSKTYSDGTTTVNYSYDQTSYNGLTITNGKGRRTGMSDNSGSLTAWSYDAAGRPITEKRTIAGITKTSNYSYTVGGEVLSISYPYASTADRVLTYNYSNIGRPTQAADTGNSVTYVKNATYAPQGDLSGYLAGNSGSFAGITVSNQFNNRLQPAVFSASTQSATIFSQTYVFTDANGKNDGNLMQIVNNVDNNRTQTFGYDYLNRLTSAVTTGNSSPTCWGQNFTYDRYGNLYQIAATKCSPPTLSLGLPSATTNRFVDSGFSYDAVGNMTNDGPPLNTPYTYNADNQMTALSTTTMTYDGDGLRVAKSNNKLRWRAPGGGPFITTTDSSGNAAKDVIYFAGHMVAERVSSSGAVNYYFGDQIGSSHMVTNSTGGTCWDADYYPFGGANVLTMTTCQPVYKYAQMESDSEISADMDYATFRYYDHRFTRFMSPDPVGGDILNPQSWNRYAYVQNSPSYYTDPLGLFADSGCAVDWFIYVAWACDDGLQGIGEFLPFVPLKGSGGGGGGNSGGSGNSQGTGSGGNSVPLGNSFLGFNLFCAGHTINTGPLPPFGPLQVSNPSALSCALFFLKWNLGLVDFLTNVGIAGSAFIPLVPIGDTPAAGGLSIPFAVLPGAKIGCLGIGPGASAPATKSLNVGPLLFGNLDNAQSILSGWSLSFGVQPNPGRGAQYIWNFSGPLGGPTAGSQGTSIAFTISGCAASLP